MAAVLGNIFSCMIIMSIRIANKYIGRKETAAWFAMKPNRGGIQQVPAYAEAICTPIRACDLSLPKFAGVECMMDG